MNELSPNSAPPWGDPAAREVLDDYLDRMQERLPVRPRDLRRIMSEVEEHLNDDVVASVAAGSSPEQAARDAINRFGPPAEMAHRFRGSLLPSGIVAAALFRSGLLVCAIGAIAIGFSGLLAWVMGALFGQAFVSGDFPGVTYTLERCAQYAALVPGATSCQEAAIVHHFGETVEYRVTMGILGLIALVVWALWRRASSANPLPAVLVPAVLAGTLGVAAAVLAMDALNLLILGRDHGAGAPLSGAIIALIVAAAAAVVGLRRLSPA
jgi:hypothetical protein